MITISALPVTNLTDPPIRYKPDRCLPFAMMIPAEPRTLPPGWVERFDADGNVWYDIQEEQDEEPFPPPPQPNNMSFAQKLYASSLPAPGSVRRSQSYQVTSVPPSVPEHHMQPRRATTSSTPTVSLVARAPSSSQNPPSPPARSGYTNPPPTHPSRQPPNRTAPSLSPPRPMPVPPRPPVPTRSAYSPPVPSYSPPAPPPFPSQSQYQPPTRDRGILSDTGGAVLKVAGGALLSALTGGLLSSESVDGLMSVFSGGAPSAFGFDYSGLQAVAQGLPGAQYQSLVDMLMQQQQGTPGVDYQSIVNELLNIQQSAVQSQAQAPSYQSPASYQPPAPYQPPASYQPPAPYQPPTDFMSVFHQQHQQIMEQNLQNIYGGHHAPTANLYEQIRYNQQQATMQMMQSMMDAQKQGVGAQQAQTQAILNAVYGTGGVQPAYNPYHGAPYGR